MATSGHRIARWILAAGLVPVAIGLSQPVAAEPDLTRLVMQMQQMREEIRELRGMVESQQREIENLQRRQRDQYLDLDRRLSGVDAPAQRPSPAEAPVIVPEAESVVLAGDDPLPPRDELPLDDGPEVRAPIDAQMEITPLPQARVEAGRDIGTPSEAEQAAYDRAFRALRETRYADAAEGFEAFLRQYPDSSYAPNAQYWLAETYYVTRDFDTALSLFQELLDRFPGSNKAGDALLKIGFSHYELRQWSQARAALEQVRAQHPGTTLERLADNRLRTMRLEGHL